MVKEECGFTTPWLDLDREMVKKVATGKIKKVPKPLDIIYPPGILSEVKGKNVLCLAAGGGQQSAVFGILGANVTVLDLSDGQLAGDQKAAAHYGYKVRTVQGDMSDLSAFKNSSFDLVYQPPSMGYVPDIGKVYRGVARILRPGGLYVADAQNPLAQFVDENSWDGKGYRISVPYAIKGKRRAKDKNVMEFRHYLSDSFNGLIEAGFTIERVEEEPPGLSPEGKPKPGTWPHSLLYVPGMFVILARKSS